MNRMIKLSSLCSLWRRHVMVFLMSKLPHSWTHVIKSWIHFLKINNRHSTWLFNLKHSRSQFIVLWVMNEFHDSNPLNRFALHRHKTDSSHAHLPFFLSLTQLKKRLRLKITLQLVLKSFSPTRQNKRGLLTLQTRWSGKESKDRNRFCVHISDTKMCLSKLWAVTFYKCWWAEGVAQHHLLKRKICSNMIWGA